MIVEKNELIAGKDVSHEFDVVLSRDQISTAKWEMEIDRLGNRELLGFGTADMDFRSPKEISEALQNTARVGHFGYPFKQPAYYEAMIGFYKRKFGWEIKREWISHSTGIYPSMRPLIDQLTNEGDEIVYQSPVHFQFKNIISANKRVALANPLAVKNGRYEMDFEHLESVVSPRTRMLLLCNPHNPVGRVWTPEELKRLADFCVARNIIVLSDEVYCGLLFKGQQFTPFASVSKSASMNTVTLVSASKMFNLTGLKHSQVVTENPELMATYLEGFKQDASGYGGSLFGQVATEVAYRDCDGWLDRLMHYVTGNYEFACEFLRRELPDITVYDMESTYFLWLDLSKYGISDADMRKHFEDKFGLVLNYGIDLGPGGEGCVRFNIGAPRSLLIQGLDRLKQALS